MTEIGESFKLALPHYLKPVDETAELILAGKGTPESAAALAGMISALMATSKRAGYHEIHQVLSNLLGLVFELGAAAESLTKSGIEDEIRASILELKTIARGPWTPTPIPENEAGLQYCRQEPSESERETRQLIRTVAHLADRLRKMQRTIATRCGSQEKTAPREALKFLNTSRRTK